MSIRFSNLQKFKLYLREPSDVLVFAYPDFLDIPYLQEFLGDSTWQVDDHLLFQPGDDKKLVITPKMETVLERSQLFILPKGVCCRSGKIGKYLRRQKLYVEAWEVLQTNDWNQIQAAYPKISTEVFVAAVSWSRFEIISKMIKIGCSCRYSDLPPVLDTGHGFSNFMFDIRTFHFPPKQRVLKPGLIRTWEQAVETEDLDALRSFMNKHKKSEIPDFVYETNQFRYHGAFFLKTSDYRSEQFQKILFHPNLSHEEQKKILFMKVSLWESQFMKTVFETWNQSQIDDYIITHLLATRGSKLNYERVEMFLEEMNISSDQIFDSEGNSYRQICQALGYFSTKSGQYGA